MPELGRAALVLCLGLPGALPRGGPDQADAPAAAVRCGRLQLPASRPVWGARLPDSNCYFAIPAGPGLPREHLEIRAVEECLDAIAGVLGDAAGRGDDEHERERGEDHALKAYREAIEKINKHNLVGIRDLVERQYHGVQRNHDQVKALRNQARARS